MCSDDVRAIINLIHRYPELIDAGDFDGVAALFAHAELRSGENRIAGATLAPMLREMVRTYEDGRPGTKHVVSNVIVEHEPGATTATARSYVTVFQARPGFPLQPIVSARHHDTFECVDGAWRFRERVDITDLVGDMSHHVTQPYHADAPPG